MAGMIGKLFRAGEIDVTNLSRIYENGEEKSLILDRVSLKIRSGEFVALTGPSGSGKSTLMNMMGLLDTPTAGAIHLDGQDTSRLAPRDLANIRKYKLGFVFQAFHLLPNLSAWQNVALPLRYQGVAFQDREQRARAMLSRVGLEARADHRPGEMSGGQKQRVAVARALIGNPSIVLADEPTGNLDSKAADEVLDILTSLHMGSHPATIVMVTHDLRLAARCSRIVELRDGRIVADTARA